MTILDFVRLIRVNLKLFIIGMLVGALIMFGYSMLQPKVYASTASGYVTVGSAEGIGDVISGNSAAIEKAGSYIQIVKSRKVAEEILAANPELNMSAGAVSGNLTAALQGGSALIQVTATGSSPEVAQVLANSALEATAKVVNDIEGSTTVRVVPLEDAAVNNSPVSPNTKRNVLLGAVAGIILVFAIIFLRKSLDVKIRTRKDATDASGVGILGTLPETDDLSEANIMKVSESHHAQENIRQLRTNLRFVNVDNPPRSVIVTSSEPGEGKSTVSTSLARALAETGQPTIILDADLRRPTVAKKFQIDSKIGLTQVLADQVELSDAVRQYEDSQLFILPAGRIPPNPSELLGSDKMRQLIKELSEEFMVIVDVPPLLPVTDASLLSRSVDGVILVGSVGKTRKDHLKEAAQMLKNVDANILGMVVNRTPLTGLSGNYYGFGYAAASKGYSSYYGTDQGQAAEKPKKGIRLKKASK